MLQASLSFSPHLIDRPSSGPYTYGELLSARALKNLNVNSIGLIFIKVGMVQASILICTLFAFRKGRRRKEGRRKPVLRFGRRSFSSSGGGPDLIFATILRSSLPPFLPSIEPSEAGTALQWMPPPLGLAAFRSSARSLARSPSSGREKRHVGSAKRGSGEMWPLIHKTIHAKSSAVQCDGGCGTLIRRVCWTDGLSGS